MPRPKKCRRICKKPEFDAFCPKSSYASANVILSVDEYEVIRLIDYEKYTQEQCAKQIGVARTTVTEMYEQARYKIADCIINGKELQISGGNYELCEGNFDFCKKKCPTLIQSGNTNIIIGKGENQMRIAVTYENGEIFQHFGHTKSFKLYDIEKESIVHSQVVNTLGAGHGALAAFLVNNQVDTLICGGIGGGAQMALSEAGIKLYGGVSGNADDAVKALIEDSLEFNPNVHCDHHDHEHREEKHQCGHNGCGNHN